MAQEKSQDGGDELRGYSETNSNNRAEESGELDVRGGS
jgi:hypothetical protein